MSVLALAARIKALAADPECNVARIGGVVAAVHAANPPIGASVDVVVLGTTFYDLPYLSSYTPVVGDLVEMSLIGALTPVLRVDGTCA